MRSLLAALRAAPCHFGELRGVAACGVIALAAAARPALAEPTDLVRRPIALAAGELEAQLVVELGVRSGGLAEPLSLAPDIWYGVGRRWTIGVVHSHRAIGLVDDGASVCFRSSSPGDCDRRYSAAGLDARWSWLEGPLAIAPRARLLVRDVDPWKPAVALGALVRWTRGRFAIASDPYLQLGLANRDRGNRAALVVPLSLGVQPTCRWLVALRTGWDGQLATARDGWHIPIGLAVEARAASHVHLLAEAGFRSLLGPQIDLKERSLSLALAWRP